MTILVIEDSRFLRLAIERSFTKAGHKVIAVGDGQEGLGQAQQMYPDVILLDMMLPGMDGTSVLIQLKQNQATKAIPVIVLSGLSQKNEQKLKMSGAAAYFEKSSLDLERDSSALVQLVEQFKAGGCT
jgi:CheY-like chemotaxis protein